MTGRSPWPLRTVALGVAIVAVVHALSMAGGVDALSFDGFRYLAGTASIMESGSYRDIDGTPQQVWPPGTSLLYAAAARLTGRPPESLIAGVNIAAIILLLWSFLRLLELAGVRWWLASAAFAAVALDGVWQSQANKLLSDPMALALQVTALCL